jgi:hypothetical protein
MTYSTMTGTNMKRDKTSEIVATQFRVLNFGALTKFINGYFGTMEEGSTWLGLVTYMCTSCTLLRINILLCSGL